MPANASFVETFQAGIGERGCPVVLLRVNRVVNVLEADVQLLGVPEIHRHHGRRNGMPAAEDNITNGVHLGLRMRLKGINEETKELEFLGLGELLKNVPIERLARCESPRVS